MNPNKNKSFKIVGWILFLFAIGLFCLQMGYLFVHERVEVEYIDNRLFYIINIMCAICLYISILLLLSLTRRFKLIGVVAVGMFIIVHAVLLVDSNKEIKNIISVSPDFKHVFSIKEHVDSGESVYYRSYYGILGRPKETLPYEIDGKHQVEWLANDVAAFTYQTAEDTIQQFVGTYGDRKNGLSYYYVGAEIHGEWQGDNVKVVSEQEGISITENNKTELFAWDDIQQFGTLAIVLVSDNEAGWIISLNEDFVVHSDVSKPTTGSLSLYKATMEENEPLTLRYKSSN
ncbi:hypothetical protein ACLIBG_00485 [Virgibacillus sp. W0181]|uniref:hypothetical protein n=1 Tax=Virgibacillus sp. W0181 TaxID=3391581 RepID=UPI003F481709